MKNEREFSPPPEEFSTPGPESSVPPEEFPPPGRGGRDVPRKKMDWKALMLILALSGLTGLVGKGAAVSVSPAATPEPETVYAAEPTAAPTPAPTPAPTQAPTPTPVPDAQILIENSPWAFADSTVTAVFTQNGGWWYNGEVFGRFTWTEDADGHVSYSGSADWLGYPDDPDLSMELMVQSGRAEGQVIVAKTADSYVASMQSPFDAASDMTPTQTPFPDTSALDAFMTESASDILCGTVWQPLPSDHDTYADFTALSFLPDGTGSFALGDYGTGATRSEYAFSYVLSEGLGGPMALTDDNSLSYSAGDGSSYTVSRLNLPCGLLFTSEGPRLYVTNILTYGFTEFTP